MAQKNTKGISSLISSSLSKVDELAMSLAQMEASLGQQPSKKRRLNNHLPSLKIFEEARHEVENFRSKILRVKDLSEQILFADELTPLRRSARKKAQAAFKAQTVEEDGDDDEIKQEDEESWNESDSYKPVKPPKKKDKSKRANKESKKTSKKKKRERVRGDYTTLAPEARAKIYQLLYEQAQIWYDITQSPELGHQEKLQRKKLLISHIFDEEDMMEIEEDFKNNNCLLQQAIPSTAQTSAKESLASKCAQTDIAQYNKSFQEDVAQFLSFQNVADLQDPDLFFRKEDSSFTNSSYGNFSKDDESMIKNLIESNFLVDQFFAKNAQEQQQESNDTKIEEDIQVKIEENALESPKSKKISSIPFQLLGNKIKLTIPESQIITYLKDNEMKIAEENTSNPGSQKVSIVKALADAIGIPDKTLKRYAQDGPLRKTGGGRKRLDSKMEQELTKVIIAMNKKGRPPTRSEVKVLAQNLKSVRKFIASKGWLDKYFHRVERELYKEESSPKTFPARPFEWSEEKDRKAMELEDDINLKSYKITMEDLKKYFKIVRYIDVKAVETKVPVVKCLKELGMSNKILKALEKMKFTIKSSDTSVEELSKIDERKNIKIEENEDQKDEEKESQRNSDWACWSSSHGYDEDIEEDEAERDNVEVDLFHSEDERKNGSMLNLKSVGSFK